MGVADCLPTFSSRHGANHCCGYAVRIPIVPLSFFGGTASSIRAMPSARALLVSSLLTEPPYGCLGPSGNDRYRKRSLRSQTVGLRKSTAKRGGSFAMNRPPADVFGHTL